MRSWSLQRRWCRQKKPPHLSMTVYWLLLRQLESTPCTGWCQYDINPSCENRSSLRRNTGARGNDRILGNHHNPIPYKVKFVIEILTVDERSDDHAIADLHVL